MTWRYWSLKEKGILIDNHNELTTKELSELLPRRSIACVNMYLRKMNLSPMNRTCHYCEKKFNPKRRNQIYCCSKCAARRYHEKKLMPNEVVIQSANRAQRKV